MQLTADIPVAPELPTSITLEGGKGELGHGGHSQLQRGYDHQTDCRVAVKFLDGEMAKCHDYRERLRREAEWLYRIDDKRVPRLYTYVDSCDPCIVMEYVDGESLKERIDDQSKPRLTAPELQHIGAEVADVLVGTHAAGIVDRDITPGNIMIDSDDGVHVVDFGIATDRPFWGQEPTLSMAPVGDSLTATGSILGTLGCVAPEVLEFQPLSPQVDVYGLGATLYCAAVGHAPFEATTVRDLANKQRTEDIQPMAQLRPDIPAELSETIDQALAMDPRDRPNPIEFKEALLAVAA